MGWPFACSDCPAGALNGLRRLVGIAVLDLAAGCLALFLVGMVVSPWIGL